MRSTLSAKNFNMALALGALALMAISFPRLFGKQEDRSAPGRVIGEITAVSNDARVKQSLQFNWSETFAGAPARHNDMLFTNAGSSVSFRLAGGQEATISEQALVRLRDQSLDLRKGEIELNLTAGLQPLIIVAGTTSYTLSPQRDSKVKVASSDGRSVFQVTQGEVRIQSRQVDAVAKEGEEVLIAQNEQASKANSEVELLYPNGETLLLKAGESFHFQAKNAPVDSAVRALNLNTEEIQDFSLDQAALLAPGEYQWGLIKEGESISHPAYFAIHQKVAAPRLLRPNDLEEIVFYQESANVEFAWEPRDGEINVTDEFGNLVFAGPSEAGAISAEFQQEGVYEWSARRNSYLRSSDWSGTRKFILSKARYQEGAPIVIELKRPDQLATFTWEDGSETKARFRLSKTADFKNIVWEGQVDGKSSVDIVLPEVGFYYWVVEGENKRLAPVKVLARPAPAPTKPQAPSDIELKLKPKRRSSSFFFPRLVSSAWAQDFEAIQVRFAPIEEAKLYELEIFSDQKQERLLETITSEDPEFSWTPPRAGSYTWRFRYQDYWGRWSPHSDPAKLNLAMEPVRPKKTASKKPPVKKPQVKKPRPTVSSKPSVKKAKQDQSNKRQSAAVLYAPASIAYKNRKGAEIEIDGEALGGHAFSYQNQSTWPLRLFYQSSYGKVFDDEDFAARKLSIHWGKRLSPALTLYASVIGGQLSKYALNGGKVEHDGDITALGLGVLLNSQINIGAFKGLNVEFAAYTLQLEGLSMGLSYDYSFSPRFSLQTKLSADYFSLNQGETEIASQSFQVFIGPVYHFQ